MSDPVATILVVEDEPSLQRLTVKVLSKHGFRVILAVDGVEALEKFDQHQEEIDLVLLDFTLPGVPGEEVLRNLLARTPPPRILISTGIGYVPVTLGNGDPVPLIAKPWTPSDLTQQIREMLKA